MRVLAVLLPLVLAACVGSGKVARTESIEPLPPGLHIVSDTTVGCRDGESGFDYRFVVVGPTRDLSDDGPLLSSFQQRNFYHSVALTDDLPWALIGYQHRDYPLRLEIAPLDRYLAAPAARTGPPPDSLPADVRAHADQYVLIAMRPTDFACTTPL